MRGLLLAPFRGVRAAAAARWWAALALAALIAPALGYPVGADVDPAAASSGPSAAHWLGTDHLGRDVAHRALLATRSFVGPGAAAVGLSFGLGIPLGAAAGWPQALRPVAEVLIDAVAALPAVVLVLLVAAAGGGGSTAWVVGAGVAGAPGVADLVRERLERLAVESHVEAARAHGFSEVRILWVHGVWVGAGRALTRRAIELLGGFAALECTLSYLGPLGVPEPTPSWGNMIAFEWGRPLSAAALVPAVLLWATAAVTTSSARALAEETR